MLRNPGERRAINSRGRGWEVPLIDFHRQLQRHSTRLQHRQPGTNAEVQEKERGGAAVGKPGEAGGPKGPETEQPASQPASPADRSPTRSGGCREARP